MICTYNGTKLFIKRCQEHLTGAYLQFCQNHKCLCRKCLERFEDPMSFLENTKEITLSTGRVLILFKEEEAYESIL